jgi:Ran-binding protein 3
MAPATSKRRESPQPSSDRASTSDPAVGDIHSNSDGESGEKPVREKLRDTTIAGQSKEEQGSSGAHTIDIDEPAATSESSDDRGRLRRKRSRDDLERGNDEQEGTDTIRHVRKRSRETIPGADVPVHSAAAEASMEDAPSSTTNGIANGAKRQRSATPGTSSDPLEDAEHDGGLTSPKNKRTRDQVMKEDEASGSLGNAALSDYVAVGKEEQATTSDKTDSNEERKVKRSRDSSSPHASGSYEGETVQHNGTTVNYEILHDLIHG